MVSPRTTFCFLGFGAQPEGKDTMVASAMTRRGALSALGAFGLTLTSGAFNARAQSGLRFSGIRVNVEPLRARFGDPTAAWMEQALAQALPQALGPHLAPGDRSAPVLEVRIDWIYLGPSNGGTGPGAPRRTRSSEASSFGDREAGSSRKSRCARSRSIIRAPSTRRWSSKPITGVWSPSRGPSPAGRRGSSGFRAEDWKRRRPVMRLGA